MSSQQKYNPKTLKETTEELEKTSEKLVKTTRELRDNRARLLVVKAITKMFLTSFFMSWLWLS